MQQFRSQCRRYGYLAVLALFTLLWMQSTVAAQQTGSITGTVLDSTGAVVPGANIILTNEATLEGRKSVSNAEGFFVFSAVVTGTYDVRIEARGFRTWEKKGLPVQPGDKRTVGSISLVVGAADQVVTVESTGTGVDIVASGDRAALLTPQDIKNLALQGRDVSELLKTLPGFANYTGGGGLANQSGYNPTVTSIGSAVGNGYIANGAPNRAGGVDLISDGAHVIDPGCNCNATQTINADMVQEVKVSTSTFGADSAKGPVVIQAVGKSGSSEYHGSAYLHFRDASMFSNDAGLKAQSMARPDERYWYPGGQFGGPIPKTNKKITFFTGYEYYNQSYPDQVVPAGLLQAVVPTASMRQGLFSQSRPDNAELCTALSQAGGWHPGCSTFDGFNQYQWWGFVPVTDSDISAYLDPNMVKYVNAMLPMPNTTPMAANQGNNYQTVVMTFRNGYMWHGRVDFDINPSTKLYVSYNQQKETNIIPVMQWWTPTPAVPFPGRTNDGSLSHTISGNLVKIFSPTLTNEFRASFVRMRESATYGNYDAVSREAQGFTYRGIFGNAKTLPSLTRQWWIPDMPNSFQADNNGYNAIKLLPAFSNDMTKVYRTHTFKFGLNWERTGNQQLNYQVNWAGTNGQVAFGPYGATGNPIANMMLGMSTAYAEVNKQVLDKQALWTFGFYGQDDWKVAKNLTLTVGLRVTHDTSWADAGNTGNAVWYPNLYDSDVAMGNTVTPGLRWHGIDSSVPLSGRKLDSLFFMPRIGVAYDIFGTGKAYLKGGFGVYYFHDQWNTFDAALSTASGMAACTVYGMLSSAEGAASSAGCAGSPTAIDPSNQSEPKTYTYNFTVAYQTSKDSLLEISYSGNKSSDLLSPLTRGNPVPLGAMVKDGVVQVDPVTGKTPTMTQLENNSDGFNKNHYRPYQAYADGLNLIRYGAWANYNSLQISWNKPRGNLTYGLNYTWSKTLGINGTMDPINMNNDYGIMNSDRPHALNATYSYDVGDRIKGGNKFLRGALNNWMISGITTIQSGAPVPQSWRANLYLQTASGPSNLYYDNIWVLGSTDYTLMPTHTCDPLVNIPSGSSVNGACFSMPTVDTNGQYQFTFRGPVYWNSDLAVQKTFKLSERQNMQFRVSAFNFMNHALPSYLACEDCGGGNLSLYMVPAVEQSDYTGYRGAFVPGFNVSNFGKPEAHYGRRVVQMSLKYNF